MKNELFHIGPVTVYGYGLMIAIGVIMAYVTAEYRGKKKGINPDILFTFTIWSLLGGILGAKVLYVLTDLKGIIANPKSLLDIGNGFVVYGGIIGGIITAWVFCRVKKLDHWQYFDLALPSVALAQGFGRIGCFLAGCCYGQETHSAFGITFHDSAYAPNGISLVPTQLISSGLNFLHFAVLIWIGRKYKKGGVVTACYLIFYSVGRFVLEMFRGDLERGSVGSLSTSQFISLFIVAVGIVLLVLRLKGKEEAKEADE